MINGVKVLGMVPARGGSKGIPNKNLKSVGGRTLIKWTIDEAKQSKYIDQVIVSTDSMKIKEEALRAGADVPFIRPDELASDTASSVDAALHTIDMIGEGFDLLVLLQPTSPLRTALDIDACIELAVNSGHSCTSVTETDKPPHWMYFLEQNQLEPVLERVTQYDRRQECPKTYSLNGAVYVIGIEELIEFKKFVLPSTMAYEMPKERSIDIDTEYDLRIFQVLA